MTTKLIVAAAVISITLTTVWGRKGGVESPSVVSAVAPIFPPTAIAANVSGSVVVEVKIRADGSVAAARIIEGHPLLRQVRSFEDTARRWKFQPVVEGDRLRNTRLTFLFRIMPKETLADELTPVYTPPYQVEVRHHPFLPVVDSDPPTQVTPSRHPKKKT